MDRSWKGKELCNRVERVLSYSCAGASYTNRAIQPGAGEFAGFADGKRDDRARPMRG